MIKNKQSKVSIIILTWNGIKHISNCLKSIQKSTYPNYEIIVVDNGSKDGTPDLIRNNFPNVKLILNKKNFGFTGGNNIGIKKAIGDIIFLLNDDTKIHPNLIEVLVKELESSSRIGIVGPKIYFMDEPNKIWFAGGKIDWAKSDSFHLGRDLTDKKLGNDSKKEVLVYTYGLTEEVDFITGCALMIKKEVIDKIGLLDNKFFAFYEDADWCQKAKKAGYQVVYIPFGGVWHIKSATASRIFLDDLKSQIKGERIITKIKIYFKMFGRYIFNINRQKYIIYRNRFIFFMRHASFKYKITFFIRFIFIFTPKFLWMTIYQTSLSLFRIAINLIKNSKIYKRIIFNIFSNNLYKLAELHGTDKLTGHQYIQYYDKHFHNLRMRKLNILEIGVGGYTNPNKGGNSLRMWKYYFPKSKIYSIDIYDKSFIEEDRIKIFKGNQTDEVFLRNVYKEIGNLDIVIDDGSHLNKDVITSFKILFPLLNIGGIYVIEDTQTSYWPDFEGDSDDLNNPATSMNFFKSLTDCLNYEEFIKPGYIPSYYDKHIISIHFYHNLIFIYKGNNNEGSNLVKNNIRKY